MNGEEQDGGDDEAGRLCGSDEAVAARGDGSAGGCKTAERRATCPLLGVLRSDVTGEDRGYRPGKTCRGGSRSEGE